MALDHIKAGAAGAVDTIAGENPKLFPDVNKLAQNWSGGVSGLAAVPPRSR